MNPSVFILVVLTQVLVVQILVLVLDLVLPIRPTSVQFWSLWIRSNSFHILLTEKWSSTRERWDNTLHPSIFFHLSGVGSRGCHRSTNLCPNPKIPGYVQPRNQNGRVYYLKAGGAGSCRTEKCWTWIWPGDTDPICTDFSAGCCLLSYLM